jgi:hypothetical protein
MICHAAGFNNRGTFMSHHKFVYTVSGVALSDEQKATISREIGAAVARVLATSAGSKTLAGAFLNIGKINGGRWLDPSTLAKGETVAELVAQAE